MASSSQEEITQLLVAWSHGDKESVDKLVPLVYEELRRMANRYLADERTGHTLQPSDVVHEAYFRLVDQRQVQWQNRGHFFALAAQAMRRILVDHARKARSIKRGGGFQISLERLGEPAVERSPDLIALDDALTGLAAIDPGKARIVELRYFGGLSLEETAAVVDLSRATVVREWRMAKAWLHRELHQAHRTDSLTRRDRPDGR